MKNVFISAIFICAVMLSSCNKKNESDSIQPDFLMLGGSSELNKQIFNPPIVIDANLNSWECDVDQDGKPDLEFRFSFEPAPFRSAYLFQTVETKGTHIRLMFINEHDLLYEKTGDTIHHPGIDVYERRDSLNCNGEGTLLFDLGITRKVVPWRDGQLLEKNHLASFGKFTYATLGANIIFPVSVLEGRPFHTSIQQLLQCDIFPREEDVFIGFVINSTGKLGYVKLRVTLPLNASILEIAVQK
jgi:hypothetical protein